MTDTAPAAASRGSRVPLAGMSLPVVSAKTVQLNDAGVVRTVHLAAPNVAGLLEAAGVPLKQSDAVVPAASSPVVDGMQIQVTRIRIEKVTAARPAAAEQQADSGRDAEHEPSGRRRSGNARHSGRHVRCRDGERRRDRQAASSQCRGHPGSRRRGSDRCKAGHRSSSGPQRRPAGMRFRGAKREVIGPSTPVTVFTAACNLTKTPGSDNGGLRYAPRADLATREEQIAIAEVTRAAPRLGRVARV